MTRYKLTNIAGVACALAAFLGACDKKADSPSQSAGAGQASPDGAPNAAETYRSVHAALGVALLSSAGGDKPASTALTERGHVKPGPASVDLTALLKEHAQDIERLVEASRLGTCDFGVDYGAGLETQIPHMSMLRSLARVLKSDADRLLDEGDLDGAAQRVAAIERIAAQILRPAHTIIELLVAKAVAQVGTEFVNAHAALAKAPWKTDIQKALAELEQELPRTGAAISHDMNGMVKALREGSKMLDMRQSGGSDWSKLGQGEREEAARKLVVLQAEVDKVWTAPDAVARLEAIEKRAVNDGVGELMASRARTRKSMNDLLADIKKAKATLGR